MAVIWWLLICLEWGRSVRSYVGRTMWHWQGEFTQRLLLAMVSIAISTWVVFGCLTTPYEPRLALERAVRLGPDPF